LFERTFDEYGPDNWVAVPNVDDFEVASDIESDDKAEAIVKGKKWGNFFQKSDNYPRWNSEYEKLNDIKTSFPWDPYDTVDKDNYNRVIRSSGDAETGRSESFRRFLENDYIDMQRDRGDIINLEEIDNNLLVHMERSLVQTRGQERLKTTEGENAFIGSGNIFSVEPEEMFSTDLGFGGLQFNKSQIKCEDGYFWADDNAKAIYHLSASGGIKELTSGQFGLKKFFDSIMQNRPGNENVRFGYDSINRRVMVTFIDAFETLSYYPRGGFWGSRHSFQPDRYVDSLDDLITFKTGSLYIHDDSTETIYGSDRVFRIEFAVPHGINHKVNSAWFNADEIDRTGTIDEVTNEIPFEWIRIKNDTQNTDRIDLTPYDNGNPTDITSRGNCRRVQGVWRINHLRVTDNDIQGLPSWAKEKKLEDDYHIVDFKFERSDRDLKLKAAGLNTEQTIR